MLTGIDSLLQHFGENQLIEPPTPQADNSVPHYGYDEVERFLTKARDNGRRLRTQDHHTLDEQHELVEAILSYYPQARINTLSGQMLPEELDRFFMGDDPRSNTESVNDL